MNKKEHALNGVVLGISAGVMLEPSMGAETARACTAVTVPVLLGTLLPDLDTAYGRHRKTGHNLFLLGAFCAFPYYFNNLNYVWIGLLTHYILDFLGTRRGLALFWPLSGHEFDSPVGVSTDSWWAWPVTLLVTLIEVAGLSVYFWPTQAWGVAKFYTFHAIQAAGIAL